MPIDPRYPNDIFLSYAREDVAWARLLASRLEDRGLVVFRDEERLIAGPRWDDQLVAALDQSRQLVRLFSPAADASDWVNKEGEHFVTMRRMSGVPTGTRLPIVVILEGEWESFDRYESVNYIKDLGAYAAGAAALPESVWLQVTNKVEEGVRVGDERRPIPVVVLTTTRPRLADRDPDECQGQGLSLNQLAGRLGLTCDAILDRYGVRRLDWQPFGDGAIDQLLDTFQNEINAAVRGYGPGVRWEVLAEAVLWDVSASVARDNVARLKRGPCLIVLDPIAFFDAEVKRWYENVLIDPLENPDALVLVPSPADPATVLLLRERLEEVAFRAYKAFYEPSLKPGTQYARAGLHVADRRDLKGWLLTGLRPVLTTASDRSRSVYTQASEPRP